MSPAGRLRERIRRHGPLPFASFMEEALYGPGGYYARPDPPIGPAGDFITGSSLSPLFGRATWRLLRRLDAPLGRSAELLEAGCGGGAHLAAVAAAAAAAGEVRRLRGWDRVSRPLPAGVERVASLDEVAPGAVTGVVFAYELFDALPIHRLIGLAGGGLGELWVDLDRAGGRFVWRRGNLSDPSLAALLGGEELAPGQVADLAPGWGPLAAALAARLARGVLVVCDYGFERRRLLDRRVRRHGTLACYRRHRVHRNPFAAPGEEDLTAHVDLTAIRAGAEGAGLTLLAATRQAAWLVANGVFEDLDGPLPPAARAAARALLDPAGMGEEIRVLAFGRGVEGAAALPALPGAA